MILLSRSSLLVIYWKLKRHISESTSVLISADFFFKKLLIRMKFTYHIFILLKMFGLNEVLQKRQSTIRLTHHSIFIMILLFAFGGLLVYGGIRKSNWRISRSKTKEWAHENNAK